ncbi:MAG: patatin-like phospholipase family protein [Anaerolineae bacterium]|nr:patatin-like phospholipase family protein [Anaerolineae bacterium]
MKPFRKHVAIAIDGGGIKGVMVTRALAILEEHLGLGSSEIFQLAAGTSTGSIISSGIAVGLSGSEMHRLYTELGNHVFRKSLRSHLWFLTHYRYPQGPLRAALQEHLGALTMGDLWDSSPRIDTVITAFDLIENRTRFIKPWKPEYAPWPVVKAVLASSSVPTYFPAVEGRYVDGGVGSYANPCYVAAYEIKYCLGWDPAETTLISLGTGRDPHVVNVDHVNRWWVWQWLSPLLGAFMSSAADQQVHLVDTFFEDLDFRRFQVDFERPIAMDDPSAIPELTAYGDTLGEMIIQDQVDWSMSIQASTAPSF